MTSDRSLDRPLPARPRPRLRRVVTGLAVLATAVGTTASLGGAAVAGQTTSRAAVVTATGTVGARSEAKGDYDARDGATPSGRARTLTQGRNGVTPAAADLARQLGTDGVLDLDPTTGTVRQVADLSGFLTGASRARPVSVVRGYLAAHHDALGLTTGDLAGLRLSRDYVDVAGTHHLSFTQRVGGLPVFGNGLTAAVTSTGRLLELGGSPVTGASALPAASDEEVGSAQAALSAAHRAAGDAAGATTPGAGETATPVAFVVGGRTHRAWSILTLAGRSPAVTVVDATSGRLLYRHPLSDDLGETRLTDAVPALHRLAQRDLRSGTGDASARQARSHPKKGTGLVFTYFPRARHGGSYRRVDFSKHGWLTRSETLLKGNNVHAWSDVRDDNKATRSEEVHPSRSGAWDHTLKPFKLKGVSFCGKPYPCSWNPDKKYSWRTNREQNATQVFYFANNWHDHLAAKPIGFTEAAGNFQVKNHSHKGKGGDPVHAQTDDGADTQNGLPDGSHVDNANMSTPPDGKSPTMQMYLQHTPGTSYPDGDPFAPTNVGDEADTVYHEYTHGLSNRLVVDASGHSTLGDVQAGAMGEGWSDWYAMDYLVAHHLQADKAGKVDVVLFQYDGDGVKVDRTEPMDCPVGSTSKRCPGGSTGHRGGYTYADYGKVIGSPEVHADSEIWSQTLWQLRSKLGSKVMESLVTRAMELSANNPSYLDMRDAIYLADNAVFGGRHGAVLRSVFAQRGMGFYAGALSGNDASPAADFHVGPVSNQKGTITGTVTDGSGQPVSGVKVTLKFQGAGSVRNPTATTGSTGTYTLGPVPVGHYAQLIVQGKGYQPVDSAVDVTAGTTTRDAQLVRDWASVSGGATVAHLTGPDFGDGGCGPQQALDLDQGTVWGSTVGDDSGTPTNQYQPKAITVKLPQAVTISSFEIDPSAGCGDGGSASLGQYTIEVSADDTSYTQVAAGTFTSADRGRLNTVTPSGAPGPVRYVRLTELGNQTPDFATSCPSGNFSGCAFTDLTELEVLGS